MPASDLRLQSRRVRQQVTQHVRFVIDNGQKVAHISDAKKRVKRATPRAAHDLEERLFQFE